MDDNITKSIASIKHAKKVIKKKMLSYIAAGLGLVAGLAWNDAITQTIKYFIPDDSNSIIAKILYAVLITAIVGLLLFYIEKSLDDEKD